MWRRARLLRSGLLMVLTLVSSVWAAPGAVLTWEYADELPHVGFHVYGQQRPATPAGAHRADRALALTGLPANIRRRNLLTPMAHFFAQDQSGGLVRVPLLGGQFRPVWPSGQRTRKPGQLLKALLCIRMSEAV